MTANALRLKERGYKYYEYNEPLKLGKVSFIHGAFATNLHAKKHLLAYGENIIYGHTHDVQVILREYCRSVVNLLS